MFFRAQVKKKIPWPELGARCVFRNNPRRRILQSRRFLAPKPALLHLLRSQEKLLRRYHNLIPPSHQDLRFRNGGGQLQEPRAEVPRPPGGERDKPTIEGRAEFWRVKNMWESLPKWSFFKPAVSDGSKAAFVGFPSGVCYCCCFFFIRC